MRYCANKGLGQRGQVPKAERERYLTLPQVQQMVGAVRQAGGRNAARDEALIVLGFFLGLRIGEVVMLSRDSFRDLEHGEIHVRTLKAARRLRVTCTGCGQRLTLAGRRGGRQYRCTCGALFTVRRPKGKNMVQEPLEASIYVVEHPTQEYIKRYIGILPPWQRWLFAGQDGMHLTRSQAGRIFGSWVVRAGLSPKYSFHALRHGRGLQLWEATHDLQFVRESLRHQSMSSTALYVHLSPGTRDKYRQQLETQMEEAMTADG